MAKAILITLYIIEIWLGFGVFLSLRSKENGRDNEDNSRGDSLNSNDTDN